MSAKATASIPVDTIPQPAPPSPPGPDPAAQAYNLLKLYHTTERGNADIFCREYAGKVQYDHSLDQWMIRDDKNGLWRPDKTNAVREMMQKCIDERRRVALSIPADHANPFFVQVRKDHISYSYKSEALRVIDASVARAESMPAFTIDPDIWDHDRLLLGTPEGIYDLRSGKLYAGTTKVFLSKSTRISPSPTADCPYWYDFLMKAMAGSKEMISYLQRVAGYALTGMINEQALILFIGEGGNGKGTFLETLADIYGDYAQPIRTEVLLASKYDIHPTELCDLKGARLVIASEPQDGRTWNEGLLKRLTGSDTISARRVHQDAIHFTPTHTLIINCNHDQKLTSVGEAERRRFQKVIWGVNFKYLDDKTFKPGDVVRERGFDEHLRAEAGAILRWCLDGVREWLDNGLKPPQSVIDASQAYMDEQDNYQQWIDEALDVGDPDAWTETKLLWESWSNWCYPRGNDAGRIQTLVERLRSKGYKPSKSTDRNKRGLSGLTIRETGHMGLLGDTCPDLPN